MKKTLFILFLSMFSSFSFSDENKSLNFSQDMSYITNLVGEKKTIKFFVTDKSEMARYFKQIDEYEKSMYYDGENFPDITTLKSIESVDGGYNIVIDITQSKNSFYVLNDKKTQYVKYTYNYGYVTDVDVGFILEGNNKEIEQLSTYLIDLIEKDFYSKKYNKYPDLAKMFTSFSPWNYYYKNTYQKDDSLVVVKFKDFGSFASKSVVNVSLQSVKFNYNRERIIAVVEKNKFYEKY